MKGSGVNGQGSNFRFLLAALFICCILMHLAFLFNPVNAEDVVKENTYAIGVILPLSGRYAAFGEDALKGVLLAAGVFSNKGVDIPVEVVVKDSKDSPSIAINAVKELAENDEVIGIVGPLLSITAFEAVNKSQELKIPIIALSQMEGLPQVGDYVFRNFMTQAAQAKAIARYAVNMLNVKRVAIFYPDNPYGRGFVQPFKDELSMNGANIVAEEIYNEGQTDFSKEIKKLLRIKETERKEGRRTIKQFNSTLSVDALFIPDYFDTVSLIVSHLAYFNVKGVRFIGSSGWNAKKLIELSGEHVEDSVFVDGFFLNSPRQETRLFASRFADAYGVQPGILEAEAFDAASMIMSLLKNGNVNRQKVRNGLSKISNFKGATGNITFNADGDAVKELFILTIKNGEIVQLN